MDNETKPRRFKGWMKHVLTAIITTIICNAEVILEQCAVLELDVILTHILETVFN